MYPVRPQRSIETIASFDQWSEQSQKNPVSASAMLTGKFLQIRKVFANPESFCNKLIIG